MEHKFIKNLEINSLIEGIYALKELKKETASNGSQYLNITVCDKTGDINGKKWDADNFDLTLFEKCSFVSIKGKITEYKGNKQVTFNDIAIVTENDHYNIEDLLPTSPEDPNKLYNEIIEVVSTFKNEDLKNVVNMALSTQKDAFIKYPAAKSVHHEFLGGLIQHTCGMVRLAISISDLYSKLINKELLISGTILHDIAKIPEFETNNLGLVTDYTLRGKLLGHLYMGGNFVQAICSRLKINEELSTLLQHMVISHHKNPEFGACKIPAFIEADILAHIDLIDAHMYMFDSLFKTMNDGEFKKSYLFGTEIYKHNYSPNNSIDEKDEFLDNSQETINITDSFECDNINDSNEIIDSNIPSSEDSIDMSFVPEDIQFQD